PPSRARADRRPQSEGPGAAAVDRRALPRQGPEGPVRRDEGSGARPGDAVAALVPERRIAGRTLLRAPAPRPPIRRFARRGPGARRRGRGGVSGRAPRPSAVTPIPATDVSRRRNRDGPLRPRRSDDRVLGAVGRPASGALHGSNRESRIPAPRFDSG